VDRAFVLGQLEKETFVRLLRKYETFCGVRVVTFCIMDNHFHLLLEIPQRPQTLPSDDELLARVSTVSGAGAARELPRCRPASDAPEKAQPRPWNRLFPKLIHSRQNSLRFPPCSAEISDLLISMSYGEPMNARMRHRPSERAAAGRADWPSPPQSQCNHDWAETPPSGLPIWNEFEQDALECNPFNH
jgi:hypothetical protein